MTDDVDHKELEATMEPRQDSPGTTTETTEIRAELLARLGLPEDASDQDVAAAHRAAVALLEHVPAGQDAWAKEQLADIEAVSSLLADHPSSTTAPPAVTSVANDAAVTAAKASAIPSRRRSRLVWVAAASVIAVGGAFGVHTMNASATVPGITGAPDTSTSAAASSAAPVDPAKVSALMEKISANPKDVTSLTSLADLYFQAGDYKNSAIFSKDVADLNPKSVTAWVGLGAAQFNLGDSVSAEKSWLTAIKVDPKNAEAHYDLGFLYLSSKTPALDKVRAEWQKVIDIDPTSDIAKTVKTHLTSLDKATPSPSASGK